MKTLLEFFLLLFVLTVVSEFKVLGVGFLPSSICLESFAFVCFRRVDVMSHMVVLFYSLVLVPS